MKKYYELAIKKNDVMALFNYGNYLNEIKDFENMIKYYDEGLQKINQLNDFKLIKKYESQALINIILYYSSIKDESNFITYSSLLIEKYKSFAFVICDCLSKFFVVDLAIKYMKYLNTNCKIKLNQAIQNDPKYNHEICDKCYICHLENKQSCIKECKCNKSCVCIDCYIQIPKCAICEN